MAAWLLDQLGRIGSPTGGIRVAYLFGQWEGLSEGSGVIGWPTGGFESGVIDWPTRQPFPLDNTD